MGTVLSNCITDDIIQELAKEILQNQLKSHAVETSLSDSRVVSTTSLDNESRIRNYNSTIEAVLQESPSFRRLSEDLITENGNGLEDSVKPSTSDSKNVSISKDGKSNTVIQNRKPAPVHARRSPFRPTPAAQKARSKTTTPSKPNIGTTPSTATPQYLTQTGEANKSASGSGKVASKSKSGKIAKAKSSRDILNEALGENGIVDNMHPIEIKASFDYEPGSKAHFHYCWNPESKEEFFQTDCSREKLLKLDISLDKNGNPNVGQFIKGLLKLYTRYNGTINLNGIDIKTDKNTSRRLKILTLDIQSSPIVLEMSAKGIKGVAAMKSGSGTKLEVRGETEFGQDHDKWILFMGKNANEINLVAPEGKGKLFICLPTAPAALSTTSVPISSQDSPPSDDTISSGAATCT